MSYPPPPEDQGRDQDPTEQQSGPPYGQPPQQDPYGQPGSTGQYGPSQYGPSQYGPSQYGQPSEYGQPSQYAQPGFQGSYNQAPGTNILAILALVFAFVFAPAAIVLGHLARRQIRQTGEQGMQLANWGLGLGYVFSALYLIFCCGWLGFFIWASTNGNTSY